MASKKPFLLRRNKHMGERDIWRFALGVLSYLTIISHFYIMHLTSIGALLFEIFSIGLRTFMTLLDRRKQWFSRVFFVLGERIIIQL